MPDNTINIDIGAMNKAVSDGVRGLDKLAASGGKAEASLKRVSEEMKKAAASAANIAQVSEGAQKALASVGGQVEEGALERLNAGWKKIQEINAERELKNNPVLAAAKKFEQEYGNLNIDALLIRDGVNSSEAQVETAKKVLTELARIQQSALSSAGFEELKGRYNSLLESATNSIAGIRAEATKNGGLITGLLADHEIGAVGDQILPVLDALRDRMKEIAEASDDVDLKKTMEGLGNEAKGVLAALEAERNKTLKGIQDAVSGAFKDSAKGAFSAAFKGAFDDAFKSGEVSGKKFIDTFTKTFTKSFGDAMKKVFEDKIVNPLVKEASDFLSDQAGKLFDGLLDGIFGGLGGLISGNGKGGKGGVLDLVSSGNSIYNLFNGGNGVLSGISSSLFGSVVTDAVGASVANSFAAIGVEGVGASAGLFSSGGLGALGSAMPYIGAIVAVAAALGAFKEDIENPQFRLAFGRQTGDPRFNEEFILNWIKENGGEHRVDEAMGGFDMDQWALDRSRGDPRFRREGKFGNIGFAYINSENANRAAAESFAQAFLDMTKQIDPLIERLSEGLTQESVNKIVDRLSGYDRRTNGEPAEFAFPPEQSSESVVSTLLTEYLKTTMGAVWDEIGNGLGDVLRTQFGDDSAQEIMVWLGQIATLQDAFEALGLSAEEASKAISSNLLEKSGGFDAIAKQMDFYYQNFFSEDERKEKSLDKAKKVVEDEFAKYNVLPEAIPKTREEFRRLVESLDLTTDAGQGAFAELMKLAPVFAQIADAAASVSTAEQKLQAEIDEAKSNLMAAYQAELSAINAKISAQEALISRTKAFVDRLREYRDSLRISELSPLNPWEKYQEARRQYDTTRALAMSGDEGAMARLESVSGEFLRVSRDYYASSNAYSDDFRMVDETLGGVQSAAERQLAVAQAQLNALNAQIANMQAQLAELGLLNENAMSFQEALKKYLDLISGRGDKDVLRIDKPDNSAPRSAFGSLQHRGDVERRLSDKYGMVPISAISFGPASNWINDQISQGQALNVWENVRKDGFSTYDIDLIMGWGEGTTQAWLDSLDTHARGGRAAAGPMIVGEEGREIFWPDTPGYVFTAGETQRMLRTLEGDSAADPASDPANWTPVDWSRYRQAPDAQPLLEELRVLRAQVAALTATVEESGRISTEAQLAGAQAVVGAVHENARTVARSANEAAAAGRRR